MKYYADRIKAGFTVKTRENIENLNMPSTDIQNTEIVGVEQHNSSSKTNWLAVLAHKLGKTPSVEVGSKAFSFTGDSLSEDELDFLDILSDKAEPIVKGMTSVEKAIKAREEAIAARKAADDNEEASDEIEKAVKDIEESIPEPEPFSSDMSISVHISRDLITAYCCIFPAIGNGKSLSAEELYELVEKNGVKYGVDEAIIQSVLDSDSVLKMFVIARGIPKKDGVDGEIHDHYSRERKINIASEDGQVVDYKSLNWLQTVHTGDVICDIKKPVPHENGMDVRGVEIKAVVGKKVKVPAGQNTAISDDGLALVATSDGQLAFKGGAFRVDQIVNIDGDVDNSVGNLNVLGSINVKGNVAEGFTLTASGDIVVRGIVEGAYLKAGGNIQIFHGMNGNLKGKLEARGNVTSRYLENCNVYAGGVIKSDSIISSTVVSNDKVTVQTGKGVIIASDVTGFRGIEAKTIGNNRNRLSNLTVGSDPSLHEEMQQLKTEVKNMGKKLEENEKNIRYLENMKELNSQYKKLLSKLKLDSTVDKMKLAKKEQRIADIAELLTDVSAQIIATEIYPPVNVTIGNLKLNLIQPERMCRIYKSEGEIIVGKK